MASPLNYFRKHQGYILAVLGVILIVTWVIGPSAWTFLEPSQKAARDKSDANAVAHWKNGTITRAQLDRMRWEHQATVSFLYAVIERAVQEGATPQAPLLRMQGGRVAELGISPSGSDPAL